MPLWKAGLIAAALVLSGCATIPDVTVHYYFPRAKTQFAVTQTIGCSPKVEGQHRIIRSVITVTPTITNGADVDWKNADGSPRQGVLRYRAFRGTFDDADATVALTSDGRLASINATSAGQGDTIVKNLVTVAGAVLLSPARSGPFVETVEDRACAQVDKYSVVAADPKSASVVTLNYSLTITYLVVTGTDPTFAVDLVSSPGYGDQPGNLKKINFVPDAASKPVFEALQNVLGERMGTVLKMLSSQTDLRVMTSTTPTSVTSADEIPLELNKVAVVNLEVDGHAGDMQQWGQIWGGPVPVPMRETYQVPIPSPTAFGKTAFGIGLSDYGSITTLHYGDTNGAPDATDAMGQIAKALQPKTAEDKANAIKGQADLIAQQQRLIGCEVSPSTCK
jgi:hypothetical protein